MAGNILERFQKNSVGSAGRLIDYTPVISSSGNFTILYDIDAILNSWNNILITPRGSMDHDPEYGSTLYLYLFEPADQFTEEAIKNEIIRAISTYDNRAIIKEITTTFYNNMKGFNVSIIVDYQGFKTNLKVSIHEGTLRNFE